MKRLILTFILIPGLAQAKIWTCDTGSDVKVSFKNESETSVSTTITKGKIKKICLFQSSGPASDVNGAGDTINQNFRKVSCTNEQEKLNPGMDISEKAYTKISHDKKKATFFVFSGMDPLQCKLIK